MDRFKGRRTFMALVLAFPFWARGQACGQPTPRDTEGPFYKPGAPMRASLVEPGAKGELLVLSGRVLGADCRPVAGAVLDFWHADPQGDYDNAGYRYRGKVAADAQGAYRLETILPPPYAGRPRHIHVKVHHPGGKVLTTQLYFPGEARRENPALVVKLAGDRAPRVAGFDFVM